jgi:chordin
MALTVLHSPETFSAILTLEGSQQQGVGGITLLTLSDAEDSLHFLLLFRGLLEPRSGGKQSGGKCVRRRGDVYFSEMLTCSAVVEPAQVPLRLQILHQEQLLRELQANVSTQVRDGLAPAATCSGLLLLPTTPCSVPRNQALLRCCLA